MNRNGADDGATSGQTVSSELLALAERCEKASGPDRSIDITLHHFMADVAAQRSVVPLKTFSADSISAADEKSECETCGHSSPAVYWPPYTASIDAALTLVPHGCLWDVDFKLHLGKRDEAGRCLTDRHGNFVAEPGASEREYRANVFGGDPWEQRYARSFQSAALALCAAALKARAHLAGVSPPNLIPGTTTAKGAA